MSEYERDIKADMPIFFFSFGLVDTTQMRGFIYATISFGNVKEEIGNCVPLRQRYLWLFEAQNKINHNERKERKKEKKVVKNNTILKSGGKKISRFAVA